MVLFVCSCCHSVSGGENRDLSKYFGFGEMEVIKLDNKISNLNIVDLNNDGKKDIVVANNKKSKIEIFLQKDSIGHDSGYDEDMNLILPANRFDKQPISLYQKIYSLKCSDFNNDGLIDIAFYGHPKNLYILLQQKNNTGSAILKWQKAKIVTVKKGLLTKKALACGDINGDGLDDIVIAGKECIYLVTQNKSGNLDSPVQIPVSSKIKSIHISDINGDSFSDLITVTNNEKKPLSVYLGLKNGSLGPCRNFFIEQPWATKFYNLDDKADNEILTVENKTGRLTCYKMVSDSKNSDLDWPIEYHQLPKTSNAKKRNMVIADFDGDNLDDIVISSPDSAELSLYKQSEEGNINKSIEFPSLANITAMIAADIDGDSRAEIACLSIKEKTIGISQFKNKRISFPKPLKITDEPVAMQLSDIDLDGTIDCVYVSADANDNRSLAILYNINPNKSDPDDKSNRDVTICKLEKLISNPENIKIVDADQDGKLDIIILVSQYDPPIFIRQTNFREFQVVDSPAAQLSLIKSASAGSIITAAIANNTSEDLILIQDNFLRSLKFNNGQTWTVIDQYNSKTPEDTIIAATTFKLNKTEPATMVMLNSKEDELQIFKQSDDKIYRFDREIYVGDWSKNPNLKFQQIILNGKNNHLIIFDGNSFAIITIAATGTPTLHTKQLFNYETKIRDGLYAKMAIGDINADKNTDIVMVEYKKTHLEILTMTENAEPVSAMRFRVFNEKHFQKEQNSSNVTPRELTIADVTGDNKNDLVTIIHDRIIIYPQN